MMKSTKNKYQIITEVTLKFAVPVNMAAVDADEAADAAVDFVKKNLFKTSVATQMVKSQTCIDVDVMAITDDSGRIVSGRISQYASVEGQSITEAHQAIQEVK